MLLNEKSLDGSRRKVLDRKKEKVYTESDLIMYLPEDGILFTGDLVFNKFHPYMGEMVIRRTGKANCRKWNR